MEERRDFSLFINCKVFFAFKLVGFNVYFINNFFCICFALLKTLSMTRMPRIIDLKKSCETKVRVVWKWDLTKIKLSVTKNFSFNQPIDVVKWVSDPPDLYKWTVAHETNNIFKKTAIDKVEHNRLFVFWLYQTDTCWRKSCQQTHKSS